MVLLKKIIQYLFIYLFIILTDFGLISEDFLDTFNPLSIWSSRSRKPKSKFGHYHSHNEPIQEELMDTLSSLPIWPIHSSEEKFLDAKSGYLLPYELPFFSFSQDTIFYK